MCEGVCVGAACVGCRPWCQHARRPVTSLYLTVLSTPILCLPLTRLACLHCQPCRGCCRLTAVIPGAACRRTNRAGGQQGGSNVGQVMLAQCVCARMRVRVRVRRLQTDSPVPSGATTSWWMACPWRVDSQSASKTGRQAPSSGREQHGWARAQADCVLCHAAVPSWLSRGPLPRCV